MSNNINNNSNARANRGFASSSSSNGGGHGAAAAAKSNSAPRRYQASPSQTGFDSRPSLRSAASASGSGSISNDSADPREKFFPNSRNYYLDDTDDDALHRMDRDWDHSSKRISWRGFLNLITLLLLALGLLALFAGYPIYSHFYELSKKVDTGAFNLGGTNGTGQVPDLPIRGLVDGDTLDSDKKITLDGVNYHIVFSDE
ncbi:hypothetical protein IE53DRAFT_370302 [Violaceomyces palustris]|uniref:Uncharacterized protein n=1 Tax=Violaceomyces palustris TaxID=1673888 RepID=A0ACD0NSK9_9BASI|nr:hypothetical protein IE53DRAFT_370302 [Violaceomyces palustris]